MKLLVVEESIQASWPLTQRLTAAGHVVDRAGEDEELLAYANTYAYDALVLDFSPLRPSSLNLLQRLRSRGNGVGVLVLATKHSSADRIQALDHGADDIMASPCDFGELAARLRALARRQVPVKATILALGELRLDSTSRQAYRHGNSLELTHTEFALLELLARHPGQVFSQARLVDRLKNAACQASSNVIEVLVSRLRKKIDLPGRPSIVKTRRGLGYFV